MVGRKEDLDDLIAAFDRAVHEDYPNPKRVDCPGRAALMSLATQTEGFRTEAILDHIRQCATCLDDLKTLRTSREGDV